MQNLKYFILMKNSKTLLFPTDALNRHLKKFFYESKHCKNHILYEYFCLLIQVKYLKMFSET